MPAVGGQIDAEKASQPEMLRQMRGDGLQLVAGRRWQLDRSDSAHVPERAGMSPAAADKLPSDPQAGRDGAIRHKRGAI